jgi:hypothetical protein
MKIPVSEPEFSESVAWSVGRITSHESVPVEELPQRGEELRLAWACWHWESWVVSECNYRKRGFSRGAMQWDSGQSLVTWRVLLDGGEWLDKSIFDVGWTLWDINGWGAWLRDGETPWMTKEIDEEWGVCWVSILLPSPAKDDSFKEDIYKFKLTYFHQAMCKIWFCHWAWSKWANALHPLNKHTNPLFGILTKWLMWWARDIL